MICTRRSLMNDEWSAALVKLTMITAFEVLYDTTGRVGPKGPGGNWPEYRYNQSDKADQILAGTNSVGRMRARIPRNSREIAIMEHVLLGFKNPNGSLCKNWMAEFLSDKRGYQNCLGVHVTETARAITQNRKFKAKGHCRRIGLAYSTYRRRRDDGAQIIAGKLNLMGVGVL